MRASFAAFERVYRRELPFVWAAARRLGVHPAVIDDAVQDVFLTAYRRWSDLRHDASPRAWLYGVTRRVAFRYRRSQARTVRRKAAVARDVEGKATTPHRERDEASDVDAVLAVLEPGRREVFVMAELLDMSGPEIAAQLEIPLNTVYSRLRLARRELEPRLRRGVNAWAGAVRKRDQPPPEQAQRTWALLVPMLGRPPGGVIGACSVGRLVGVAVAAGVVATVAIVGRPAARKDVRDGGAVEKVVDASGVKAQRTPRSEPSPTVEPSEEKASALVELGSVGFEEPAAVPSRPSPADGRPSVRSTEPAATEPAATEPAATEAGLEAEVELIDRATASFRDGDGARSLLWLDEHERRFPAGILVVERKATRVRALCRLGRGAQARAEAALLHRDHPESPVARNTPLDCEKS